MMGVLIHVIGDCANNLGVIIAAAVIWFANYGGRFYADPAVSMGIAIMIFISSIPLSTSSLDTSRPNMQQLTQASQTLRPHPPPKRPTRRRPRRRQA